jgi:hypothetical protein
MSEGRGAPRAFTSMAADGRSRCRGEAASSPRAAYELFQLIMISQPQAVTDMIREALAAVGSGSADTIVNCAWRATRESPISQDSRCL